MNHQKTVAVSKDEYSFLSKEELKEIQKHARMLENLLFGPNSKLDNDSKMRYKKKLPLDDDLLEQFRRSIEDMKAGRIREFKH